MTERELLKLALEALEGFYEYGYDRRECFEHITAIKEALNRGAMDSSPNGEAQPAVALEQRSVSEHLEPVAIVDSTISGHIDWLCTFFPKQGTKLYTTPPQRKPLPYEKVVDLWLARFDTNEYDEVFMNFARAIEAAHGIKEKNT